MNRKSPEPLMWLLFSAGGMAAALLVPVLLFLFGLAFPLGWFPAPEHAYLLSVLRHPVTKTVLFALCVLCFFHWAHRFRYTLYDGLRLKKLSKAIIVFCYGGAVLGSAAAGFVVFRV